MNRNSKIIAVAGAIVLSAASSAFADSQLIASAGLTAEQAQGMSLTEIAQAKFNQDVSYADRAVKPIPAVHGSGDLGQLAASASISPEAARSMSLSQIAAVKFNHDSRQDDRQTVPQAAGVTAMTRSVDPTGQAFAQLAGSAGLTPAQAKGMSLSEIAQVKFDRDLHGADRQIAADR